MTQADGAEDAWRERWKHQDAWTASEFAMLCCGWNPSIGEHPDQELYNHALETITRAVRVSALPTLDLRSPSTGAERIYAAAPLFSPQAVSGWAANRYPETFPYPKNAWGDEKPLDTRERASLLIMLAALAEIAGVEKVDITVPTKAAEIIEAATGRLHTPLEKRTILKHLKLANDILDRR